MGESVVSETKVVLIDFPEWWGRQTTKTNSFSGACCALWQGEGLLRSQACGPILLRVRRLLGGRGIEARSEHSHE